MMGSAATKTAASARKLAQQAANDEFAQEKRDLKMAQSYAKLDAAKAKLDSKLGIKQQKVDTQSTVLLQRGDTEQAQVIAPIQAQAQVDATDAEARAKLVKAIPWIIGGVVVLGAVVMLRKKKSGGSR